MNFCVAPWEIREINKRAGVKISCGGVSKNHEKINVPPRLFWTWEYVKKKILKKTQKNHAAVFV